MPSPYQPSPLVPRLATSRPPLSEATPTDTSLGGTWQIRDLPLCEALPRLRLQLGHHATRDRDVRLRAHPRQARQPIFLRAGRRRRDGHLPHPLIRRHHGNTQSRTGGHPPPSLPIAPHILPPSPALAPALARLLPPSPALTRALTPSPALSRPPPVTSRSSPSSSAISSRPLSSPSSGSTSCGLHRPWPSAGCTLRRSNRLRSASSTLRYGRRRTSSQRYSSLGVPNSQIWPIVG